MAITRTDPSSPPVVAPARAAGATAALAALAAGVLGAGVTGSAPSPVEAVGTLVIDVVPPPVKDLAIALFGQWDKVALIVGTVVVAVLAGAGLGRVALRSFAAAASGFLAFALLAVVAIARLPLYGVGDAAVVTAVAAAVGVVSLRWLLGLASSAPPDQARRQVLRGVGATLVVAALAAGTGRALLARARSLVAGRDDVVLPSSREAAPPPPAGASLQVEGISPVVTPNDAFYRIDTALAVPRVDLASWRLTVGGMVERPLELSYDDLLALPMVERYITLSCVSNRVGGDLVGNALWLGVPLRTLLERAGVAPDAEQVVGRSSYNSNFTVGFPVAAAFDGREALVAVGMNGEPLPLDHGFPARLVVAGLYGYVSATKWLSEIELTTWDGFDAYWVPRGWAKEAPVKTQSRIDTPRAGARLRPGRVAVAGVAWAPHRGISQVEVSVDEGPWLPARLSEPLSDDAWRQWVLDWDASPGRHRLQVRAADGEGVVQDGTPRPPAPDGATGWHTVTVHVEG